MGSISQQRPPGLRSLPLSKPAPEAGDRDSIRIDPMHQEIYRLADEGKPPTEIARQLGRTTGEVELILNLRRDRHE